MVIIYAAATVPINPSGASSILTIDQVWAGLELKVRYGSEDDFLLDLLVDIEQLIDDCILQTAPIVPAGHQGL